MQFMIQDIPGVVQNRTVVKYPDLKRKRTKASSTKSNKTASTIDTEYTGPMTRSRKRVKSAKWKDTVETDEEEDTEGGDSKRQKK